MSIPPFNYSRIFHAPRPLVWEVHTKQEHLAQWFGPAGTQVKKFDMNFFVGGMNHYCIEIPGGVEMWGRQIYQEISPMDRIVHIQSFSDKDAGISSHPMSPIWPKEMLATTTFEVVDQGTKVTVSWQPHNATELEISTFDEARESMNGGFSGMFDTIGQHLEASLSKEQVVYPTNTSITFIRQIKAPRNRVWQVWADINEVAQWWGPEGFSITTYARDFSVGGSWDFMMHGSDGTDYPNFIVYEEINEPKKLVYSHGLKKGEQSLFHVDTNFIDCGTSTIIETTMTFATQEARDTTAKYGIEGHASTMKRLEKLLA